jgi:cysteinyl-tRNA synthetase
LGIEAGQRFPIVIAEGTPCIPGNPPIPIQNASSKTFTPDVVRLVIERHEAKAKKNFKRSDAIRDELKSIGLIIDDTPKGPKLKDL